MDGDRDKDGDGEGLGLTPPSLLRAHDAAWGQTGLGTNPLGFRSPFPKPHHPEKLPSKDLCFGVRADIGKITPVGPHMGSQALGGGHPPVPLPWPHSPPAARAVWAEIAQDAGGRSELIPLLFGSAPPRGPCQNPPKQPGLGDRGLAGGG